MCLDIERHLYFQKSRDLLTPGDREKAIQIIEKKTAYFSYTMPDDILAIKSLRVIHNDDNGKPDRIFFKQKFFYHQLTTTGGLDYWLLPPNPASNTPLVYLVNHETFTTTMTKDDVAEN